MLEIRRREPEQDLGVLYQRYGDRVEKVARVYAMKNRDIEDAESELLLAGLLTLQRFERVYPDPERRTADDREHFLAYRLRMKICDLARHKNRESRGGGCIIVSISNEDYDLTERISGDGGLGAPLTLAEERLVGMWSAPEFRDKYPRHKSILRDAGNLARHYGLDELEIRVTLEELQRRLRDNVDKRFDFE